MFLHVSVVYTFLLHHILVIHLKDVGVFPDLGYEYVWLFSFILDKYLRSEVAGSYGKYVFLRNCQVFSKMTGPFCIPTRMPERVLAASCPHQHLV